MIKKYKIEYIKYYGLNNEHIGGMWLFDKLGCTGNSCVNVEEPVNVETVNVKEPVNVKPIETVKVEQINANPIDQHVKLPETKELTFSEKVNFIKMVFKKNGTTESNEIIENLDDNYDDHYYFKNHLIRKNLQENSKHFRFGNQTEGNVQGGFVKFNPNLQFDNIYERIIYNVLKENNKNDTLMKTFVDEIYKNIIPSKKAIDFINFINSGENNETLGNLLYYGTNANTNIEINQMLKYFRIEKLYYHPTETVEVNLMDDFNTNNIYEQLIYDSLKEVEDNGEICIEIKESAVRAISNGLKLNNLREFLTEKLIILRSNFIYDD